MLIRILDRIWNDPNIKHDDLKRIQKFFTILGILFIAFFLIITFLYTIFDWLIILGLTYLCLLPAFISNAAMTFAGKFPFKLVPIDGGRNFPGTDKRILGDGKTWNGFVVGAIFGFLISMVTILIYLPIADYAILTHQIDPTMGLKLFTRDDILFFMEIRGEYFGIFLLRTLIMCFAAPLGDLVGSFLKRRFGKERGSPVLFVDQLDFIYISILLVWPIFPLHILFIIFITLATPLVAIIGNVVAYYGGVKDVPW